MNKIFKSAFVALLAVLGLTLTACVNKYEYDGALAEGGRVGGVAGHCDVMRQFGRTIVPTFSVY